MKIFYKIFITTLVVTFTFLLFAPWMLSSSWGKKSFFELLEKKTHYKAKAKTLSLSWFGPTKIENLYLQDPSGNVLSIEHFESKASLFSLLFLKGYETENLSFSNLSLNFPESETSLSEGKGSILFKENDVYLEFSAKTKDKEQVGSSDLSVKMEKNLYFELLYQKKGLPSFLSKKALKNTFKNDFYLKASLKKFPVALVENIISKQYPDLKGVLSLVLGKFLDFNLDTTKEKKVKGEISSGELHTNFSFSPFEEVPFELTLNPLTGFNLRHLITLENPLHLQVEEGEQQELQLLSKSPFSITFLEKGRAFFPELKVLLTKKESVVEALVKALEWNAIPLQITEDPLVVNLNKKADSFFLSLNSPLLRGELEGSFKDHSFSLKKPLIFNFSPSPNFPSLKNTIVTEISKLSFSFKDPLITFEIVGKQIPSSLSDPFLTEGLLSTLFGETLDLNSSGELHLTAPLEGDFTALIAGPQMNLNLNLELKDGLRLKKEQGVSEAHFDLTPKAFTALVLSFKNEQQVKLKNTGKVSFILEKMEIPWKKRQNDPSFYLDFFHGIITTKLLIDRLDFVDVKTNSPSSFDHIKGTFETSSLDDKIVFNLEANQIDSKDEASDIFFKGSLKNAFGPKFSFNLPGLSLHLQTKGLEFSAPLFCDLFLSDSTMLPKVEALLGPKINFEIALEVQSMTGPIKGFLEGKNGEFKLNGHLDNGTLSLYEDLIAKVKATPELGKEILQDVVPFFGKILEGSDLLTFKIEKEGLSFPLFPINISHTVINGASLSLGKVSFQNEGDLKDILEIFKYGNPSKISVWATPIYASLRQGTLKVERFDLLLMDKLPIAAWGMVNFPADKVNFQVGLSAAAIESAFNISGLKSNYMMQLPLKGSLHNASINKGKAVARVAALIAKQTGVEGILIGTVIDIASGKLTEPPPPPPTTSPFPWH